MKANFPPANWKRLLEFILIIALIALLGFVVIYII